MRTLVSVELLKLRTIALPWVLLGVAVAVMASVTVLSLLLPATGFGLTGTEQLRPLLQQGLVVDLVAVGVGVVIVGGEYQHRTIHQTLLTTPHRGRVLAAKLLAAVPVGLTLGLANLATTLAIAVPWLLNSGLAVDLTDGETLLDALGMVASITLCVPLGVALVSVLRLQSVALVVYVLWQALGEPAVDFFLSDVTPYLPRELLVALGRAGESGAVPTLAPDPVPMGLAALLLVGYIAVTALVASRTTLRRDVP